MEVEVNVTEDSSQPENVNEENNSKGLSFIRYHLLGFFGLKSV